MKRNVIILLSIVLVMAFFANYLYVIQHIQMTIKSENNDIILVTKEARYKDISDVGPGKRGYHLQLENGEYTSDYAYYKDVIYVPIIHLINRDKLHKAQFFGHTIYFDVGSNMGSRGLPFCDPDLEMPALTAENITRITIRYIPWNFTLSDDPPESANLEIDDIEHFLEDYEEYTKDWWLKYRNYWVYVRYKDSDEYIYEEFGKEFFEDTLHGGVR